MSFLCVLTFGFLVVILEYREMMFAAPFCFGFFCDWCSWKRKLFKSIIACTNNAGFLNIIF